MYNKQILVLLGQALRNQKKLKEAKKVLQELDETRDRLLKSVGNFVHDLVEMAKATERLPMIEAENERLQTMVEDYAKRIQTLELRLIDRATEIDNLHETIRAAEVSRDDAELRRPGL